MSAYLPPNHIPRGERILTFLRYSESPTTAVNESFTCASPLRKKAAVDLEANNPDTKFDYESMISLGLDNNSSAV